MVKVSLRLLGLPRYHGHIVWCGVVCLFVFFPCLIESFEFGGRHERFKDDFGFMVRNKYVMGNDVSGLSEVCFDAVLEEEYFVDESRPENSTSPVKFSDANSLDGPVAGQAIFNELTNEIADNASDGKSNSSVNCDHWTYLTRGFAIGAWFVIFISDMLIPFLVFIFTQHEVQPGACASAATSCWAVSVSLSLSHHGEPPSCTRRTSAKARVLGPRTKT